jgi:putative transposase
MDGPFKIKTTDSNHNLAISPNLLNKNFTVNSPNEAYVGDITYIPTNEGFVYLSTVIDLYSRRLIGWYTDDNLKTQLVENSLIMAKNKRSSLKGAIFHSDRGSQYASKEFRKLLKAFDMTQSMSAKGNCYDNAVAESFFHNLKTEFTFHTKFETKEEAKRAIERYIAFYNSTRIHSYNNYKTPIEKELEFWRKQIVIAA